MKRFLFLILVLSACSPSNIEKIEIATITCNILKETDTSDSIVRIKELNLAREKIKEERFLKGDKEIKEAIKYGLCNELILNDPEYEIKLKAQKEIELEREFQARLKREEYRQQARIARAKREEQKRIAREKREEEERIAREKREEEKRIAREKREEESRIFKEEEKRLKEIIEKRLKEELKDYELKLLKSLAQGGAEWVIIYFSCEGLESFYGNVELVLPAGITKNKFRSFQCKKRDERHIKGLMSDEITFEFEYMEKKKLKEVFNIRMAKRVNEHIKKLSITVEGAVPSLELYRSILQEFQRTNPQHYKLDLPKDPGLNCKDSTSRRIGNDNWGGRLSILSDGPCYFAFEEPLYFVWTAKEND